MRERTVKYVDDDYDVEVVVSQATVADGFRRQAMVGKQLNLLKEREANGEVIPLEMRYLALRALPECLASVKEIRNLNPEKKQLSADMTFDEFQSLPEALALLWQEAAYECNPHWLFRLKADEQGEQKEPDKETNSTEG